MPNFRSIRFRLTAWYAVILILGLGLFGGLVWIEMQHRLFDDLDLDLNARANRFEQYFRSETAKAPKEQLSDELEEFCQGLPAASYVSLRGDRGFVFRYPAGGAQPAGQARTIHRSFAVGGENFELDVTVPAGEVVHALDLLRLLLLSLIPLVTLIACAGGYWLSRRALRPVDSISEAARTISIENLSQRLPVPDTGDELARLTEVLNSMLARLEGAVKALSQFSADASHELRTPLTVMRTTADLALRRAREPESYRRSLEEILAEAERMTHLVEELLALARNGTAAVEMPFAATDLRRVVEEVCAQMRGLAESRRINVRVESDGRPALISGNAPALQRLFIALVDNAVKFSPEGREVLLKVQATDTTVAVSVEDSGAGITEEDLPHIFRRFYRAQGAGHGLGLALAEGVAQAHGGRIEVKSQLGAGSSFRVIFPSREVRLDPAQAQAGLERFRKSSG